MVARRPASRAAQATAWAWFPALAATTPACRSVSPSVASLLTAPRILNEPVRLRFSAFRCTSRPARRESVSERKTGVTRATPTSRSRARSMSASAAIAVAVDPEHPGHDLGNGRKGVERAGLDVVEDSPELGVVLDRTP